MKVLKIKDVLNLCDGILVCGNQEMILKDFCNDTRKLKSGDVYVGIKGERVDGNLFYKEAFQKGADIAILEHLEDLEEEEFQNKAIILVRNSIACLQKLATYKRSLYHIPVIAITGSVGKTSTKDMIYSVVSQKYKTHKTQENFNNHIGVPLTILSLKEEEALVIEMGMNHLKELSLLSNIVKPTIAVITNVGTAHIENLGSRENILKAKLEILEGLVGNTVIINNDNDLLHQEVSKLKEKYHVLTVGIKEFSDYQATNIQDYVLASTFDIVNQDNNIRVEVGGNAFIYNSLIAYAVGDYLNIEQSLIKKGIADFKLSPHRMEKKVNSMGVEMIDDTYNANFDSMKAALERLGKFLNKRKIAILGDMLELGKYSSSLHQQLGDLVVSNKVDILITIGEESKKIAERAHELKMNFKNIFSFEKESDSYELLSTLLQKGDIVLVKGSHGIHLSNTVDYIMNLGK